MNYTVEEVVSFVSENDVKFIRLAFCDILGNQKNISIMPAKLMEAFEFGIPFDGYAVKGFSNVTDSDLLLFPDPTTLCVLPWRPSHGRVVRFFCNIRYPDGRPFEADSRRILVNAVEAAQKMGYSVKMGAECEFYLFEEDINGHHTTTPHDRGGYMDIAPADKGENIRREICLTLEEMGIIPESSHHEHGPGQNEVDFKYADALETADNLMTFQTVVKNTAAKNGLYASFLPKPLEKEAGSGLHLNLSLFKDDRNIVKSSGNEHCAAVESFLAGILAHVKEITAFLNPLTNSYRRFGEFEAPRYITWSHHNRSQLIRIPAATGESQRLELRSPDPACNPYLATALIIYAGLDGIQRELALPQECGWDLYHVDEALLKGCDQLPGSLDDALALATESEFVRAHLPSSLRQYFLQAKQEEVRYCQESGSDLSAELELYFEQV